MAELAGSLTEARMSTGQAANLDKQLRMKPGVTERTARAIRLKNELNLFLEMVADMRQRLLNELDDAAKAGNSQYIDKTFLSKLKDLSTCYERLTKCRIDLNKAEKQMEDEMTPAEEMETVRNFVMALDNTERAKFLWKLNEAHAKTTGRTGNSNVPQPE